MKNLISMTDFVLEQGNPSNTDSQFADKVMAYVKFLKQPLELWMFVPCDEDGNVLEEPLKLHIGEVIDESYPLEIQKFQQAKQRCLFEGFEFTESQKFSTVNKIKNSVHWYTKDRLYLTTKKEDGYHSYFQLFTIEDLIKCDLQLTPTALKQIGL